MTRTNKIWLAALAAWVAITVVIIFTQQRPPPKDWRPLQKKVREGTVEIIADGVEKGVRRATNDNE